MPFVTEEMYHLLKDDQPVDLCVRQMDASFIARDADHAILKEAVLLKSAISTIRDARVKAQIKNKDAVSLFVAAKDTSVWLPIQELLCKQVNAKAFSLTDDAVADAIQLVIGGDKFYVKADQVLDTSIQRKELETELAYFQGFLESVEKKLSNEKFVNNAKQEVVDMERKKQADALDKIKMLKEGLANLG